MKKIFLVTSILFATIACLYVIENFSMYRLINTASKIGARKTTRLPEKKAAEDQIIVGKTTIKLVYGDILDLPFQVDAIVNPANKMLAPIGGLSKKIFDAAGKEELKKEINETFHYITSGKPIVSTGYAAVTTSYNLKENSGIKYIIHAVGPDCKIKAEKKDFVDLLRSAYNHSLSIADSTRGIISIAFPFISSELFQCPKNDAAKVALSTVADYAYRNEKSTYINTIYFILFTKEDYAIFKNILQEIQDVSKKASKSAPSNLENLLDQLKKMSYVI